MANVEEASQDEVLHTSGQVILPNGFHAGIIKDGGNGSVIKVRDQAGLIPIPAFPVDTDNDVGSGDVFGGVLAAGVARGLDLSLATSRASHAASIFLEGQTGLPPMDLEHLVNGDKRRGVFEWRLPLPAS
jgi:sugar/nucleoside kinase (ribokinase family)